MNNTTEFGPAPLSQQEAEGLPLLVYCIGCGHHGELPVAPLIARFGRAYPIPDVAKHCRCKACGSKQVETRPQFRSLPGHHGK